MCRPTGWADVCEADFAQGEAYQALVRAPGGQYYAVRASGLEEAATTARFELAEVRVTGRMSCALRASTRTLPLAPVSLLSPVFPQTLRDFGGALHH